MAYSYILFVYFPDGINAHELQEKISFSHPESTLSYKAALNILHAIRSKIASHILRVQENLILRGDVVVDETLWTHDESKGFANNWSRYES